MGSISRYTYQRPHVRRQRSQRIQYKPNWWVSSFLSPNKLAHRYNNTVVFVEKLSEVTPLPATHIHHMSDIYGFTTTNNAEIGLRWYELALSSPAALDFAPVAANWIINPLKGRMKFCRPIFRLVNKVDNKLAQETYKANKTSFHPIARKLIKKVRSIWFSIEPRYLILPLRRIWVWFKCNWLVERTHSK